MQKKMVVLGSGESGVGAAILAQKNGYDVFVSDAGQIKPSYREMLEQHAITFEEGHHSVDFILSSDEVVKSPGIPEKNDLVKQVRKKGIPVISEIELAFRYAKNSKIIAITGSNGKTTTTSLVYHICIIAGLDCALVGNIGKSFALQIALDPKPLYVAEISSFQLDDIKSFRPDIAILTNITEDHLDRYEYKIEKYIASKFRITMNQTAEDDFIFCEDDPVTMENIKKFSIQSNLLPITMNRQLNKGAFTKDGQMTVTTGDEKMEMSIYDFALKGRHNIYNTMAAGLAGSRMGIRKEKIREAIQSFETLEHRMESLGNVRGVEFINDSKATNVNSTWYALESMEKPTILILGGIDKGNDYSLLTELVEEKVKAIICLGLDNKKIHDAFSSKVPVIIDVSSAVDAVHESFKLAEKGDVVLLSPACASFDLFKNYEDRGQQFKQAVKEL